MDAPYRMTAHQLRDEIRNRRIGIEELVGIYLDRIDRYDGIQGLNTVAALDPTAIRQARSLDARRHGRDLPLYGLPILIKDNIDVAGLPTTAGSLALADNIAVRDAPIVANLRRNGAVILGKTNMTEFANYITQGMPNGYSARGGQVRHAYDRAKSPSGSSSGSAVAVSAGLCAAAVGTDTSFSIVGCATENGVAGLKPPAGALSAAGIIPISHTLDSAGALARDFRDAHLLYSGMRDQPLRDIACADPKHLHIAVNMFGRDQVSDAQLKRYEALFDTLRKAGVSFGDLSQAYTPHQKTVMHYEFKHDLEAYLRHSSAGLKTLGEILRFYASDPDRRMKYGVTVLREAEDETSGKMDEALYVAALSEREKLRAQATEQLRTYDACVMTGPTNIMHFTGLPSVALTLCMADDNTPRGMILYGADEERLYAAALSIERHCPGASFPSLAD